MLVSGVSTCASQDAVRCGTSSVQKVVCFPSMRLFGVSNDGTFTEYSEHDFQAEHREKILEDWLETNPHGIVEGQQLMVIGRQVTTNLGSTIDLLALDRHGDAVVVELKRGRTPRDTLAQALEYASFVEPLGYDGLEAILRRYVGEESAVLSELHAAEFEIGDGQAVAFNKNQHIVIVGSDVTQEIRQTAAFLRKRGIDVTCVEFGFFKTARGERLMSSEVVVGGDPVGVAAPDVAPMPKTTKDQFLAACDEAGRKMFAALLAHAESKKLPVHWGSRGFSMNAELDGSRVPICYGYPATSVFKQSIYTAFADIKRKVKDGTVLVQGCRPALEAAGFITAKGEMKIMLAGSVNDDAVIKILTDLEAGVRGKGLVGADGGDAE